MNKVLVLGAGMVSRPLVRYLLDLPDYEVTMASRTVSKAEAIIQNHPNGKPLALDISDDEAVEQLVAECDVAVSLLPYVFHVKVAKLCIKHKKHLVTTSYVSEQMAGLDEEAKAAGVLLLNESGLDPGIDHMSAMKVIHAVEQKGGRVISFRSMTGALPSHEANTNPFGYKFSWAPRGVLLASKNASKWLVDGEIVSYPGEQLFENYSIEDVPGVGSFENYPNRNSVPYKEIYGLKDAATVYRGTFRMTGWCETMRRVVALNWLSEEPISDCKTFADVTARLIGKPNDENLIKATADFLGIDVFSTAIKRLEWLGLFSSRPLPEGKDCPLDWLNVLTLEKMSLGSDERDMIVMHHQFVAEYDSGKEFLTSTLVDYGIPKGDSAVARTVALPAAIAVKMIFEEKITVTGNHIPVLPGIYNPILDELEQMGIVFKETSKKMK